MFVNGADTLLRRYLNLDEHTDGLQKAAGPLRLGPVWTSVDRCGSVRIVRRQAPRP